MPNLAPLGANFLKFQIVIFSRNLNILSPDFKKIQGPGHSLRLKYYKCWLFTWIWYKTRKNQILIFHLYGFGIKPKIGTCRCQIWHLQVPIFQNIKILILSCTLNILFPYFDNIQGFIYALRLKYEMFSEFRWIWGVSRIWHL